MRPRRTDRADGDRFAVEQPVSAEGFNGPAYCMAEIQDFPQAAFPFILHDDPVLDFTVPAGNLFTGIR